MRFAQAESVDVEPVGPPPWLELTA
jgi:hypothetical protein